MYKLSVQLPTDEYINLFIISANPRDLRENYAEAI